MAPTDLITIVSIGGFLLTIAALIGGWIALHTALSKASVDVADRVRSALMDENAVLQGRVVRLEKDVSDAKAESVRLGNLIALIITTFEKRGILIEVDGDIVQVRDNGSTFTVRQKKPPARPSNAAKKEESA